jgi:hypothetical protein
MGKITPQYTKILQKHDLFFIPIIKLPQLDHGCQEKKLEVMTFQLRLEDSRTLKTYVLQNKTKSREGLDTEETS